MKRTLKYLKRQVINGVAYTYFRDRAGRLTKLPGDEGSSEFARAYEACVLAMEGGQVARAERPANLPDSLAVAITTYLSSSTFARLRPSTRARQLRHCEALREALGMTRLRDLDADAIDIYTDAIAKRQGASVADRHVHVLSNIWNCCRKFPQFGTKKLGNPTQNAEQHYSVQREHRPWPAELQNKFMATAPDNLKLAKTLLHFSMQRGGDAVKMRWADYDGRGILVRQEKTHGERDAEPSYHLCPAPLREALDAAPRVADTILVNAYGRPYTCTSTLSKAIHRHLVRIGACKKGERTFVMHGLRKTGAVEASRAGANIAELKALGGWKSDSQALYYTRLASKRDANSTGVALWDAALDRKSDEQRVAERRAQIRRVK